MQFLLRPQLVPTLALLILFSALSHFPSHAAKLGYTEQLPVDTFARLREVERHQLLIAEKLYIKGDYDVALNEYEKYLTLYEQSLAASYAQLMWSHCLVRTRKVNTAIRDGFQSVIDYWPDSHEAVLAAYLIGRSYRDIGEISKATKAFENVIAEHEDHTVAVYSRSQLLELAKIRDDQEVRLKLLKQLTFDTPRRRETHGITVNASRELAQLEFIADRFEAGEKALATTYKNDLKHKVYELAHSAVGHLVRSDETRERGLKLADRLISYLKEQLPTDQKTDDGKTQAKALWYQVASTHGVARRNKDVLSTYQEIAKRFGSDDALLGHIAGWYKGQRQYDEAHKVYARYADAINGKRMSAGLHRELKKYKEAIQAYTELTQADPEKVGSYQWSIAECWQHLGDHRKAIQVYRQCDNYPEVYFRMAGCHRRLKEYKQALVLYNQAKSHESRVADAMMQIGHTYEETGEREKAIKTFQQVCKRYPTSSHASRSHAHLQNKYKISVTLGGATED